MTETKPTALEVLLQPVSEPKEISIEPEKEKILKRKRSTENFLSDSPIKKLHAEVEDKKELEKAKEGELDQFLLEKTLADKTLANTKVNLPYGKEEEQHHEEVTSDREKENNKSHQSDDQEEEKNNAMEEEEAAPQEENQENEEEEDRNQEEENAGQEDNAENGEEDLAPQEEKVERPKSAYIKEFKKPVGKKIRDINETLAKTASESILHEMKKAYEEDLKSIQRKQPALQKIKIFNEVEKSLKNETVQSDFLTNDGLMIFEQWLKPQSNGVQTSLYLKKKILEILNLLSLDRDHFSKTDIGKVVNKICLSQNEPLEIRKLAKTIIDKWTRIMTDNHINYGRYREEDYNEEPVEEKASKSQNRNSNEVDILNSQKKEVKYVLLPKKNNIEFFKNAKNAKKEETKKKPVSDNTKEMQRLLQNVRRNKNNL